MRYEDILVWEHPSDLRLISVSVNALSIKDTITLNIIAMKKVYYSYLLIAWLLKLVIHHTKESLLSDVFTCVQLLTSEPCFLCLPKRPINGYIMTDL